MEPLPLERLVTVRRFPPVVHPRHARELLATPTAPALAAWAGDYAITVPEHRHLLEDILSSLCWQANGQATLVNGLYGTGKSHLLVLLHLLAALPDAWPPFLEAHPEFRRYATPMQQHRRLVTHFSLDEFGPRQALETAVCGEAARMAEAAGIAVPADFRDAPSRYHAWAALLAACAEHGYDGLVLLVDEVSLFLAGKSPAQREADAAFLQFLAGLAGRAPVWVVGALQRNLADVGALRTHSWRQVEDRFRRYTLSPQEIGGALRDKLLQRTEPPAVRALVAEQIVPAAVDAGLALPAGDLQASWPFHPAAIELAVAVANSYLSPNRSLVEVLQGLEAAGLLRRDARQLITTLDLLALFVGDLRSDSRLLPVWRAVDLLEGVAETVADAGLARRLVHLLALLHLAGRQATVGQLRGLLFDGTAAPSVEAGSAILHQLRRGGAYLTVARESEPAAETFALATGDEAGALALARMQEWRQALTPGDPRVTESALQACTDPAWPLASALDEVRVLIGWCGSERPVLLSLCPALTPEWLSRRYEGLLAGQADGHVVLLWPGTEPDADSWHRTTAALPQGRAATFLLWRPRALTAAGWELWAEYAAWRRAAQEPGEPSTPLERRVRQRCAERAEELRPAVAAGVCGVFREGDWVSARGEEGRIGPGATLAACMAEPLAGGFDALFPAFPRLSPQGTPPRAALQQLLAHFIEPGEAALGAQSLLGEYVERFAEPLGCAETTGSTVRVTPPCPAILDLLQAGLAANPLPLDRAAALLQAPPLGLTGEQARLAVLAAVRTGALAGLDAFLQPLDPERTPLGRSDAVAFIGLPTPVDEAHRPVIARLAAGWQIPLDPWPVACCQVARRLRRWAEEWDERMPRVRAAVAEWSEMLQVLPWGWRATEGTLAHLEALIAHRDAPPALLLTEVADIDLVAVEAIGVATDWWLSHHTRLHVLFSLPAGTPFQQEVEALRASLARGEEAFSELPVIGERVDRLWSHCREEYLRWHDTVFGQPVVAALRQAFDAPEFRALKLLARLPLPLPEAVGDALNALAQARTAYCPGIFTRLVEDGVCDRCRLPLYSPSPMPDANGIARQTQDGLAAYAMLLRTHPWAQDAAARLLRAPEAIAERARAVLAWQADDGAQALLAVLDEPLLGWLCREHQVAGTRQVIHLQARLGGRDLTMAEAKHAVQQWLDPEGALGDDSLLAIE